MNNPYFSAALQYYLLARRASLLDMLPAAGHLMSLTVEMLIKTFLLSGHGARTYTYKDMRKLSHSLRDLWALFKRDVVKDTSLDKFDELIEDLSGWGRYLEMEGGDAVTMTAEKESGLIVGYPP